MADDSFRVAELLLEGFKCSHVLMKLALEAQGRDSPELVRTMSGLALGMGQGFNCGALSGGCCVLGLYAGHAGTDEEADPRFAAMLDDFTGWFHSFAKEHYGSIDCCDIMKFDPALKRERCPPLILKVWEKIEETLRDHGIDPSQAGAVLWLGDVVMRRCDPSPACSTSHVPNVEECEAMMIAAGASEAVRCHGRAVAELAVAIALRLGAAGVTLDIDLVRAAGRLHDIAKGRPRHAEVGAALIVEFGYPDVAAIVSRHMTLDVGTHLIDETAVVYLADKLVHGEQQVSLQQRFASAFTRWGDNGAAIAGARKRQADAEAILQAVVARADMTGIIAAGTLAAVDRHPRHLQEATR